MNRKAFGIVVMLLGAALSLWLLVGSPKYVAREYFLNMRVFTNESEAYIVIESLDAVELVRDRPFIPPVTIGEGEAGNLYVIRIDGDRAIREDLVHATEGYIGPIIPIDDRLYLVEGGLLDPTLYLLDETGRFGRLPSGKRGHLALPYSRIDDFFVNSSWRVIDLSDDVDEGISGIDRKYKFSVDEIGYVVHVTATELKREQNGWLVMPRVTIEVSSEGTPLQRMKFNQEFQEVTDDYYNSVVAATSEFTLSLPAAK